MSSNSSVLGELERVGLDRALQVVDELDPQQAGLLHAGLLQDVLDRCQSDGLFWHKFVRTRDEADPEHNIKFFPTHLEYTKHLWNILVQDQCVVVAKSRQMFVSWEIATFCTWWARFKPNQAVYWQTKQWKDACAMVCTAEGDFQGRCQFIEAHLPEWMQLHPKESEGTLSYPNGSMIQALPGGADQIRSKVASVIVEDEFAKQEEQAGVYTAAAPLIQKGAKFIVVSTPNGSGNQFYTLYHGRPSDRPE